MEPNIDARLKEMEEKLNQTFLVVKKIRKVQKNAAIAKIAYLAIILLLSIGALYFVKPFLGQLGEVYGLGGNSTYNGLLDKLGNSPTPNK